MFAVPRGSEDELAAFADTDPAGARVGEDILVDNLP